MKFLIVLLFSITANAGNMDLLKNYNSNKANVDKGYLVEMVIIRVMDKTKKYYLSMAATGGAVLLKGGDEFDLGMDAIPLNSNAFMRIYFLGRPAGRADFNNPKDRSIRQNAEVFEITHSCKSEFKDCKKLK